MNQNKALKEAAVFFALTLGASYFIFWGPLAVFQVPTISFVSSVKGPGWAIALFILGGFVPSLAALLLTGLWEGKAGLKRMGRSLIQVKIGWRWYLAVLAIVGFASLAQILTSSLLGSRFDASLFIQQLSSLLPLIILGPLSEELGWRGYAQARLQKVWNPLLSGLAVGVVWALWHLPLFFMLGTAQHELGMPFLPFMLTLVSLSVAFAWVFSSTGGSIWSAVFFHWMYTYASQVTATGIPQNPQTAWLTCIPYLIAAGVIFLIWRTSTRPVTREAAA